MKKDFITQNIYNDKGTNFNIFVPNMLKYLSLVFLLRK